jgi:hypothetical protein
MINTVPAARIDLTPFLPEGWAENIKAAAATARQVRREGGGPGSLSLGASAGLDYHTLNRPELAAGPAGWLTRLHEEACLRLVRLTCHPSLQPVTEPNGISLNVVAPDSAIGGGYEWHVNGTDVLYVVALTIEAWNGKRGGRFLWHDGRRVWREPLEPGEGLALRSSMHPHAVEPPKDEARISVLLAYTVPGLQRDAGLTDWLGQSDGHVEDREGVPLA